MKIIFSRKGFDSSLGKVPSPIFEDKSFFSLPIPAGDYKSNTRFNDLNCNGHRIGKVVADLSKGKIRAAATAHFDPDLNPHILPRLKGWRAIYGPSAKSI